MLHFEFIDVPREHIFDMNLIDYHMLGRKENVVCRIFTDIILTFLSLDFFYKYFKKTTTIRRYKRRILIIRNNSEVLNENKILGFI